MTLSDLSIRRPVLATVASLVLVVFGLVAGLRLPVRELPDIDTAVVTVSTNFTGAGPAIVDTDVTEVIESAVAGISGIKTISSESRRGVSRTTIEFETGRNIEEAANDVRSAVARVRDRLPTDVSEPQVVKNDSDADPVMRIAVTSDRMTAAQITDYVERYLIDRLATLDGVASVEMLGARRFAVRVWLDRRALAARNLTVADVERALRANNMELPSGDIESASRQLEIRFVSRLDTVEAFREIPVDRIAGFPVRLADLARVELGVEDDSVNVRANGREAIGLSILRQSQANTVAISNAVRAEIDALRPGLPEGLEISIGSDDALFVSASIREVVIALGISLLLVVLVILVFLRSLRATLIPAVTIPVSLIGCFLILWGLGYSVNVLTLLALILAIGLVVDDAIVVLENVQRRINLGESPLVAAALGTRQVTFAVIATSVVLISVFVPISFLEGQAGRLFIEFGFVMAGAVAISTFVALSLCPMLASKLLTPRGESGSTRDFMQWIGARYERLLHKALAAPLIVIALAALFAGASWLLYERLPRELAPSEDRGVVFVPLSAPQGSTLAYTEAQSRSLERELLPLRESGDVDTVFVVTGTGNRPYRAFVVLRLARWEHRDKSHLDIVREIIPKVASQPGARGFPVTPAGLGLRGSSTPLQVVIGGPDFESVKAWARQLLAAAAQNPGLSNPELDFEENQPQVSVLVDRIRAHDLGISVETIANTLQSLFASREVTSYIDRGRTYPVIVQADAEDRRTPSDIGNIFMRSDSGALLPLSSLITLEESASAPALRRFDRLPSITLSAALTPGYDLGAAIRFIEGEAAKLPATAKIAFDGQSRQFKDTSSGVTVTLALAILIVFLVLAAQFESFLHPVVIIVSVPLALAGAVYALALGGLSLNIYSQIGIILLVGLMAKNGILIVEFANQLRDQGRSVREAVIEASVLRLRPIVMTVISTLLGAVPLVLASGAGAESRAAIGVVVMGGLGFALLLTLFLTPVLYDLVARFTRPRGAIERALEAELARSTDRPGLG